MATQSKSSKIFGKVLSVILCIAILGTTYAGFFGGFDAAAGAVDSLGAGEVGLEKIVEQDGRTANLTIKTAAMPVEVTTTTTEVTEQVLDVVLIVDTSGSMGASYGNLIESAKTAAKELANTVYSMNSQNRIALGSFAQYAYAYNKSSNNGVEYTSISTSDNANTYYFTSGEKSTLEARINSLYAEGGTNSEGGLLVADKLLEVGDDSRQKLVIFLTDGLPTGRYKDGTSYNSVSTVATYDGSGSGIPNYEELTEMVAAAQAVADSQGAQLATVFYTGGLETNDSMTVYYKGCDSASCRCNSASNTHGSTAIAAPGTSGMSQEQAYMSAFYHKTSLQSAQHIVNDLLAPHCEAGVYMPENAAEMLNAFETIINNYATTNLYKAASNAYYDDIIPDYAEVVDGSIKTTMGSAELLKDQWVEINGTSVQRDVVRWTIGDIPETVQALYYSIEVKDDRAYGIMDASVQGILNFDTCPYTQTESPLIVQIDELILAPKGADDYYVVDQEKNLEANVKINDDALNSLIDTSGNNDDASTIVNGYAAGLNGNLGDANLAAYTTEIVEGPKWGSVVLNDDGTFTYIQNADLYMTEVQALANDPDATDEYNAIASGWEDTFTYKLVTGGWSTKYTTTTTTETITTTTVTGMNFDNVNSVAGDKLCLLVFGDMDQTGADSEGRVIIGGNLTINQGWTVSNNTDYGDDYALIVGGTLSGSPTVKGQSAIGDSWISDYAVEAEAAFRAVSQKYAELPAEGTSERNQWYRPSVMLTANPNHVAGTPHVFYVDSSEYIGEMKFKGNFGDDQIIVNVSGTSLSINGGEWSMFENCDLDKVKLANQTTWNFYEMTEMTTNGFSFQGSVLAPLATYTAGNGHVNGTTIVKKMIGTGGFEYHANNFYYDSTGIGEQITTTTTTNTTSSTTSERIELTEYNSGSTNAAAALESETVTVHIRVQPDLSDLSATKSATPASGSLVKAGDEIEYSITVYNPRTIAANGVVLSDAVPAGTTFVSAANGGALDENGKVVWTLDIPARQSATVTFKVTVNDDVTGKNNLANVAYVTYTTPGVEGSNTINTNTVAHAILSAVKSSSVAEGTVLNQGDQIVYTITVTNNGSAGVADVVVEDRVPAGVSFVSSDSFVDDGNGKIKAVIPGIAAGESAAVSFTVAVDEFATGVVTISNTAEVNGEPTNTTENTAQRGSVTVYHKDKTTDADLLEPTTATGKTGDAYGPYTKAEITNYRYVDVVGSPSGSYTNGNIEITFYYDKIPGSAVVYYVDTEGNQLREPETVTGWQGDTIADKYGKLDTIGNWLYQSTDDSDGYVLTEAGIEIIHVYKLKVDETLPTVAKAAQPASGSTVKAGDQIVYTISVTNNKYEAMHNVTVLDTAPKGTTIVAADGGTVSGSTASWVIDSIASGATVTVSFTVQVNGSFDGTGNLANTASVQYTEREADTATTVNTNTTTHAVLVAEKYTSTIADGFVGVGDTYTYFIKVQNVGTAAATGIVVEDAVPKGTTLAAGSVNSWTFDLAPGAEKIVSFDVVVSDIAQFKADIYNTATVNGVPTNTTTTEVQKGTVDVHFVDEEGNALAESVHYEGTPGDEHGNTDAIVIPGYTYQSTTGETDGKFYAGNITITHIYTRTPAIATILYVDMDTDAELLPRATENGLVGDTIADEHYQDITNYQFIETNRDDGVVFTDEGITIIHYYRFIKPDDSTPSFVKTASPATGTIVREGEQITYTLTFKNTRIDPVYNLVITDRIPDGATLVSADVAPDASGVLSWTFAELASGESASVSFTVKVNEGLTGYGNLANVAKATFENRDNEPEEPVYSNETKHPVIEAKLDHYNNQPNAILTQGDEITYVITVTNTGSATAYDVPVISYIPEKTTFVKTADGTVTDDVFESIIPELAPGQTVELTFTVVIDEFPADVYSETIPNIANVDGVDTNTVEDIAKIGDLVINHIDFDGTVIKTESSRARVGTAYGPISDIVSTGELAQRQFVSVDNSVVGSYTDGVTVINFYYDKIPATLVVKYLEKDTEREVKETASYNGYSIGDEVPAVYANEVAIDGYIYHSEMLVTPEPMVFDETTELIIHYYERILDTDLPTVEKASSPASGSLVEAGDVITYNVTVTNVRATDALQNVVVTDAVPAGMTYVEGIAGEGVYDDGVITWNIGSIAAGRSVTVTFKAKVNDGITTGKNLGNTAKVAYRDVQTGEDKSLDSNPTSHALLSYSKSSSVAADTILTDGNSIQYSIAVKNVGSATAKDVVVVDSIPANTVVVADTLPEGATFANGAVTYTIDSLEAGATETITFTVVVKMGEAYSLNIKNTATVNGDPTNEVTNIAQRGTVTIKYVKVDPDGTESALTDDTVMNGEVGDTIALPTMKQFEALRHFKTHVSDESETYIAGNIDIIYYFERIPATATVYYRDVDVPSGTIAPTKTFEAYVGDLLPETYVESIQYYTYKYTDAPTTLEYTENGLVITHWYDEIIDKTELTRSKTASPASGSTVLPGDSITYTITVTNPRREALSDITITDPIPAGCTVTAAEGATVADGNVVWNGITLGVGETKSFSFTVLVDSSFTVAGNLANKAAVTFINRKDTEPTTLYTETVNHAILVYNKEADKAQANVGSEITYTINVANYGSIASENVTIVDAIPAGTTLKAGTIMGGTSSSISEGVITWNIAKLTAGETAEVSFTVIADAIEDYRASVTNAATVNDEPTNSTETIVTKGTVTVTHVDDKGNVLIPKDVTTGNVGAEYVFTEQEIFGYDYKTVQGEPKGKLIEGNIDVVFVYTRAEGVLNVVYRDVDVPDVDLINPYTEEVNVGDVVTDLHKEDIAGYTYNSTDHPDSLEMTRDGINIIHWYEEIVDTTPLQPTKSSEPAAGTIMNPGEEITYFIEVLNPRFEKINNVTVTDAIPAGTTLVSAEGATEAGGVLTWTIDEMAAGEKVTVRFTVKANETFVEAGNLSNTATISYVNRKDTAVNEIPTNTVEHPVLMSEKSVDKAAANVGDTVTYTISVTNWGATDAKNFTVVDKIPNGTTLVKDSAKGAEYKLVNNVLTFTVDSLAAGDTIDLSFAVTVDEMDVEKFAQSIVNVALVADTKTNEVETTVTQGTVSVTHVDEDGNVLIATKTETGNVGDSYAYEPEEIEGYDYVSTKGEPEGKFIEGNKKVVFVFKKGEGVLTVRYLEEDTKTVLANAVTEVMPLGEKVKDLKKIEIDSYEFVSTDKPSDLKMTREGIEIIHYYKYAPETYTVTVNAWEADLPDSVYGGRDNGVEDLQVVLLDKKGNVVAKTYTDKDGTATFEGVVAGVYTVDFVVPANYKIADAIDYSEDALNSVVDTDGDFEITVVGDTDNIGMEIYSGRVLGASDEIIATYDETTPSFVSNVNTVQLYEPVETEQENATYTRVLGDVDTSPNTGDSDMGTIAAVMIAACALFVLILCRKGK